MKTFLGSIFSLIFNHSFNLGYAALNISEFCLESFAKYILPPSEIICLSRVSKVSKRFGTFAGMSIDKVHPSIGKDNGA